RVLDPAALPVDVEEPPSVHGLGARRGRRREDERDQQRRGQARTGPGFLADHRKPPLWIRHSTSSSIESRAPAGLLALRMNSGVAPWMRSAVSSSKDGLV